MLRGRAGKDISICALCQHRLSLPRTPRLPQSRLLSDTAQCARNHAPGHTRPPPPFSSVADGPSNTSPSHTRRFSTTTNPTLQQSGSSSQLANPPQAPIPNADAPSAQQPDRKLFLNFRKQRTSIGDYLNPHEAKARKNLIAQREALAPGHPNQQATTPQRNGDASSRVRIRNSLPSLSPRGVGSVAPIGVTLGPKHRISQPSPIKPGILNRIDVNVGSEPQRNVPVSSEPRRDVPISSDFQRNTPIGTGFQRNLPVDHRLRNLDPPPPSRQRLSIGQNNDIVPSRLSSMTGSGAFWRDGSHDRLITKYKPSQPTDDSRGNTKSSSFLKFGNSAANSASPNLNTVAAPPGGFDALENAGLRDAKMKASIKGGSGGGDMSQEWGQLARKSPSKPILNNLQNAGPDSTPARTAENQDNSISQVPQRHGDQDREKDRRRDPFEREKRPDKNRGGRRTKHASRFEDDDGADAYDQYQEKRRQKELRKAQREAERTEPIPIILPELISITAFANALKIKPDDFLVQLGELGFEGVTLDSLMAGETAALVAQEYGYEPTVDAGDSQDLKPRPPPQDPSVLPSRPPVVTIMGHVDHGKTTILDYLRESSVAAQEHGGITQHIGAFSVKLSSGKPITFLDTPGHAAFLTMRQRGANVTDIVVLVVAADDSVKPQTLEALKHARAAKVPIIVAINKIDKDGARVDAVKHDLAKAGVEIEDFGGDVQVVCVSGKTGQGIDDLEENILTLSEILDHRAEPDGAAEGWVLESSLKTTGKVATVLVKRGTLRPGDYIAAGLTWAKIRQLRNEAGDDITEAPPGTPVEVLGWKDLPAAGDQVIQSPDEDKAKTAVSYREGLREREKDAAEYEVINEARRALQEKRAREKAADQDSTDVQESLPDEENGTRMVNFVVKCDVHGSVEAVCAAIQEIGSNEVRPRVLRSATGPISEFDVDHAATSKSVLINFSTTTPGHVRRMAEEQGVRILDHTIIYHLVDDVKANLSEYLAPDVSTRVLGEAEILQVFPINLRGRVYKNIAGCRVRNGVVGKNNLYRVLRSGEVVFEGKLETLKHVKKDVMEMRKGAECGMGFEEYQDIEVGDQIQAYEEIRTKRSL
ncbi:translation initiation factor IF-2 [Xylaria arbuscula]|nr:translation initiation factor IF-2 [Xylaria arbuscula]